MAAAMATAVTPSGSRSGFLAGRGLHPAAQKPSEHRARGALTVLARQGGERPSQRTGQLSAIFARPKRKDGAQMTIPYDYGGAASLRRAFREWIAACEGRHRGAVARLLLLSVLT